MTRQEIARVEELARQIAREEIAAYHKLHVEGSKPKKAELPQKVTREKAIKG